MLIKGGVSPRTSSRVDLPVQSPGRPCKPPPPDDLLTFEEDVLFEWSKSVPLGFDESKRSKSRAESRKTDSHLPGLFSEVIGESLSQRPISCTSGSIGMASLSTALSSYDRRGSIGEVVPFPSRCESRHHYEGDAKSSCPSRCQTAPPSIEINGEIDVDLDANHMVDAVTEHEIRTRERSKSCRIYGGQERSALQENVQPKSARKSRRPSEVRYLQHKFRERPCSRAESFVKEELFDTTSDLSRECCDVLGPRHCYDCFKITQRNDFIRRNDSTFPSIHMTPKNLSTITLVQRLFPDLTTMDIMEGMADGYISARSFSQDRIMEIVQRKKAEARRKEIQEKWKGAAKRRISAFSVPDKMQFFSNFTDLRAQILKQRGSYTGFKGTLFPVNGLQQLPPPTEVELVIRKEEDRENPANYFCPPLMTREEILRQKSQPRFYAGSNQEYKLPDAPPLTDVIQKANQAISNIESDIQAKIHVAKPGSPRRDGIHARNQHKPEIPASIGGSGGMFKKAPSRTRPSKLGRPSELGGGFGSRKSMTASSFSRPLQMETLAEDGSQSEREDAMEEEEEEIESRKNVVQDRRKDIRGHKTMNLVSAQRFNRNDRRNSIEEEVGEEDEELDCKGNAKAQKDNTLMEEEEFEEDQVVGKLGQEGSKMYHTHGDRRNNGNNDVPIEEEVEEDDESIAGEVGIDYLEEISSESDEN